MAIKIHFQEPIPSSANKPSSVAQSRGKGEVEQGVKGYVATIIDPIIVNQVSDNINYKQHAIKHASLIAQGQTSLELFAWMNGKMHFTEDQHQGERMPFPRMYGEGLARFHAFCKALHAHYGRNYNAYIGSHDLVNLEFANTPDKNSAHDQKLPMAKIDRVTQNLLFGRRNMAKIDAHFGYSSDGLKTISNKNPIWTNSMTYKWNHADENRRVQYLIEWFNYDIRNPKNGEADWS